MELRRGCFMWDLRQKAWRVRLCGLYEFAYELMENGSFHKFLLRGYFMTKTSSGVYQLPNGMWGYRYAYIFNGKQRDLKRTKDENGNPFKTRCLE